jgi:hypothetical protein
MRYPYRCDIDALQARRATLERKLDELRARVAKLEKEVGPTKAARESIEREIAFCRDEIARLRAQGQAEPAAAPDPRSIIPPAALLSKIRVASPCHESWNEMTGDERTRHCQRCDKNVYNLSSMTAGEAEELIREKEGKLCVRYYQRSDGTILTADCPVGRRRRRFRRAGIGALAAGLVAAFAGALHLRMGRVEGASSRTITGLVSAEAPVQGEPTVEIRGRAAIEVLGDIAASPSSGKRPNAPLR